MQTFENEHWIQFGPNHEVSDYGRVRSLKFGQFLKIRSTADSVDTVSINEKHYRVAELVAQLFLDPGAECIYFKDGDIHNNHVSNLSLEPVLPIEGDEEWKAVAGYETKYMISSHGRIFTLSRKEPRGNSVVTIQGRLIPPSFDQDGYYRVTLTSSTVHRFDAFVHRLVAQAFIPNLENKPQVNHIDGNKTNNHISNLEWVTGTENIQHSIDTGLRDHMGARNPHAYDVVISGALNLTFHSMQKASEYFQVDPESFRLYAKGKSKRCHGLPPGITIRLYKHSEEV